MADYREISQAYAQGAIRAIILINSGALVACLSQIESLLSLIAGRTVGIALGIWVLGVSLGAAAWIIGFFSTRFVDISERASGLAEAAKAIDTSDRYLFLGLGAVLLSLICFLVGSLALCVSFIAM
jgi:hypothetical protein